MKLVVHTAASHEPKRIIAAETDPGLSEAEVLPANQDMAPGLKPAAVMERNVRPAANEQRLRFKMKRPSGVTAKTHRGGALYSEPVRQVAGNITIEAVVVKMLPQNTVILVLIAHPQLPRITARRT